MCGVPPTGCPKRCASVGLPVTILDAATLEGGDLGRFAAIVVGPRAYETDSALVEANGRLLAYARRGGPSAGAVSAAALLRGGFAPYRLTVGRTRPRRPGCRP